MPIVHKIPTSQCMAAKTIAQLKELFAEDGIPESIRSDNGTQFSSHFFKEFAEEWNFTHQTSSLTNCCSNGQTESAVKIIKGLLTRSKCAEDPYILHSWLTEVHLLIHMEKYSINVFYIQQYHKGSSIRTAMQQLNVTA